MNLPIEHIHKRKTQKQSHTLLLLMPALVFFLIIALFVLKINYDSQSTSINLDENQVLGRDVNVDR